MSDLLQVTIHPNRAGSVAHTALRRRPNVGIKSVLDKSILNETLGHTTVERDGRSEYQGKRVSNMVRQPALHEVWRLECSCQFNSREILVAITTINGVFEFHYMRWQRNFFLAAAFILYPPKRRLWSDVSQILSESGRVDLTSLLWRSKRVAMAI
jgi:hypothetical protein